MQLFLDANWNEVNTALIVAFSSLIAVIIGFVIAILRNETLRRAVVGKLILRVKGGQVTTTEDLNNHEIKTKLKNYNLLYSHKAFSIIESSEKAELYKDYCTIFTSIFYESINNILNTEYINMDEFTLRELLLEQLDWRQKQYTIKIKELLMTKNNDLDAIDNILRKLDRWRSIECELITDNVLAVIGYGRFNSVISKLDIVFNQYSLGIDFLIKNGAESFEKLNGELESFLNISKK
jgi:hypothetical protein